MTNRIGVYVCHCGTNIAGTIDVEQVARFLGMNAPGVTVAKEYKFMCSSLGQAMIEDDIRKENLDRVVVAACSPHLHEKTFRRTCSNAGLNPYLMQMCNIREHISWSTMDRRAATDKAIAMIRGAVERVKKQEPLTPQFVDVNPTTLVVGGGIAGLQATAELADAGYPVVLVEREPTIGGHMAQFDKTFPTLDCAACILTPKMSEVGQHEKVRLLTYSELEDVSGSVGNFTVRIRRKARSVLEDKCTGCGDCMQKCPRKVVDQDFEAGLGTRKAIYMPFPQAVPKIPVIDREHCLYFEKGRCKACQKFCPTGAIDYAQEDSIEELKVGNIVLATGYDLFDCRKIPQYGYGRLANVFTSLEFERMCNSAGPTDGHIVLRDGKTVPKSIGIIHCAGSRCKQTNEHCSVTCCMAALKFGHLAMEKTGAEVTSFYIDMRPNLKDYDEFYQRVLQEGMRFIRGRVAEVTNVARIPEEQGKLVIQAEDTLLGRQRRFPVDMVVLMGAMIPRHDSREMAFKAGISCGMAGWFTERHPKLDPVATMTDGIFIAGTAQGPKDIPSSVSQGAAAAARIVGMISRGKVAIEPVVASIHEESCSGCRICNTLCPFNAIEFVEAEKKSRITASLCKGCGTCVAACPAQAISGAHFKDDQILAELSGILWDAIEEQPAAEEPAAVG